MSVGPVSGAANVAGTSAAQRTGSDVQQTQQATTNQSRKVASQTKAEAAAGVGSTDTDHNQTSDRDADGRRLWEIDSESADAKDQDQPSDPTNPADSQQTSGARDPHGDLGNSLDLMAE